MRMLLLLLLSVFLTASCSSNKKSNNKSQKITKETKRFKVNNKSVLFTLPQNTEAIINLKSIKSVFDNFLITENSAFGIPIEEKDFNQVKDFLKMNPLSLKELENIGIDTKKEIGISFSDIIWGQDDDLTSINILSYIPVKDAKKALSFIEGKFENGILKDPNSGAEKLYLKKEKNYLKISGEKANQVLYIFVKNDYLFISINPVNPQNSLDLTTSMLKGKKPLKDSKLFQEVSTLTKIDSGVYLYGNIEEFFNSNKVRIEKEFSHNKQTQLITNMLSSYRTFSMSVAFDTKDLLLNFSTVLDKNSKALAMLKGIKHDNSTILGLDKPALQLMSFGINIQEYIKLIKPLLGKQENAMFNEKMDEISKEFGIDIKKDVINNLNGNFSLATYDGMSISATNYNSVFTIGFKDVKAIESIFEKLLENPKMKKMANFVNKTKENSKTIYIINAMVTQVYVGFKKNELIIASSKDMYQSALKSNNKTGFNKYSVKDNHLKDALNSQMLFYISFLEVIKAVNNFKGMLPPVPTKIALDYLELLDYFLVTTTIGDTVASGGYVLKTHSNKNFFPAIADIVKKYAK